MPVTTIHSSGHSSGHLSGQRSVHNTEHNAQNTAGSRVGAESAAGQNAGRPAVDAALDQSSVAERRQKALQTVEETLAMGYRKLAGQYSRHEGVETFSRAEPLTAGKVAGTILGFIERRLQMDVAEGATAEQLEARLEEGLKGFRKGFAEAWKQLEALAAFTPEIRADVLETRDRVLAGIEGLRQQIIEGQLGTSTPANTGERVSETAPLAYVYEQARASRFQFELTTAEGDVVRIDASRSSAVSMSGAGANASWSAASSESFRWSVEGDLNDKERAAIESLLGDVDRLAQQFFSGNLDGAMTSAKALGYDEEQVIGFSLNLSRSEIRRATEVYGQVSADRPEAIAGPGLMKQLEPLGHFLRAMESALEKAREVSAQPEALLAGLGERLAAGDTDVHQHNAGTLRDFIARLLEQLTSEASSLGAQPTDREV